MSQADLANAVGLERTKIAKIESGGRQIDALELAKLASALQVPMGHFLRERPPVLSRRTAWSMTRTAPCPGTPTLSIFSSPARLWCTTAR
ncbi:helix-turn-helix domain-containing protein [Amycolatopsis sp. cmx-11-51]